MAKGMNGHELQALTDALLKAERLELLSVLENASTLQQAIDALKNRLKA